MANAVIENVTGGAADACNKITPAAVVGASAVQAVNQAM